MADFLLTSTSVISQIRNDKIRMSPSIILRVYDKTPLNIEKIREMVKQDAPSHGEL
jgi:hypothetical protein